MYGCKCKDNELSTSQPLFGRWLRTILLRRTQCHNVFTHFVSRYHYKVTMLINLYGCKRKDNARLSSQPSFWEMVKDNTVSQCIHALVFCYHYKLAMLINLYGCKCEDNACALRQPPFGRWWLVYARVARQADCDPRVFVGTTRGPLIVVTLKVHEPTDTDRPTAFWHQHTATASTDYLLLYSGREKSSNVPSVSDTIIVII